MLLRGLNKLIHIRCSYHTLHVLTTPFFLATHPLGHTQPKYLMLVLLLLIPGNRKLCPLGQIQLEAWFCMANEIRMACTVLKSCKKKKSQEEYSTKTYVAPFWSLNILLLTYGPWHTSLPSRDMLTYSLYLSRFTLRIICSWKSFLVTLFTVATILASKGCPPVYMSVLWVSRVAPCLLSSTLLHSDGQMRCLVSPTFL